jgi:hypothetical protein
MTPTHAMKPLITALAHDGGASASSDVPVPWWSFAKTVLVAAAIYRTGNRTAAAFAPLDSPGAVERHAMLHAAAPP